MSDEKRIADLEVALCRLIGALLRQGTEQDGNWGWPTFSQEIRDILHSLPIAAQARAIHGDKP